jgi:ubiquinone/menaquinone biosynthesis C-methylase UbiE
MQEINYQEMTWNLVWKNNEEKSSYSLNQWRDERADDKVGYFIQSGLVFHPGERVLDAGCGDGSILFALKNHFDISIVGADFSEEALVNAGKNSVRKGYALESHKADTRNLPFENISFDKIFSLGVVEHLQNPESAVNELARCLKPGGVLVLMTPNKFSFGRIDRLIKTFFKIWEFGHQDEFSPKELSEMVLNSGLQVFKTDVVRRKRFKNDSTAFKLIFIFDSIIGAFVPEWGFYSYVYATKNSELGN